MTRVYRMKVRDHVGRIPVGDEDTRPTHDARRRQGDEISALRFNEDDSDPESGEGTNASIEEGTFDESEGVEVVGLHPRGKVVETNEGVEIHNASGLVAKYGPGFRAKATDHGVKVYRSRDRRGRAHDQRFGAAQDGVGVKGMPAQLRGLNAAMRDYWKGRKL